MTITIDYSLLANWVFWAVIYGIGFIVAANMVLIDSKRLGKWSGEPEYVLCVLFWPVVFCIWIVTLPARMIKV